MSVDNIQVLYEVAIPSYNIPATREEILQTVSIIPNEDLEGLHKITITHPRRNKEFGFFGRYDPRNSIIYLYAQLQKETHYLIGQWGDTMITPIDLKEVILKNVLPHEVGHHVGSKYNDLSEDFANNYAQSIINQLTNGGK